MIENITISPLLPLWLIVIPAALSIVLIVIGGVKKSYGSWLRLMTLGLLLILMLNPQLTREQREPLNDIAVVIVDKSTSQLVTGRQEITEIARLDVLEKLKLQENLEVREVNVVDQSASTTPGTNLWYALRTAKEDIPENRFAGAVLITDGQVHDIPKLDLIPNNGAIHTILTGQRNETDRRLVIEKSPGYGIVNGQVEIQYRLEDHQTATKQPEPVTVSLMHDGEQIDEMKVVPGTTATFDVEIEHAGRQFFELVSDPIPGEMSTANNRALVRINGVRDRLKVLLVSGKPHTGERVWRNLLKSDPSVDLVHFTILRPPSKIDFTPVHDLVLIPFPVRELFEEKLDDFDLIVFDRYIVRDIMPPSYIRNIVRFVRQGGAVLLAVGPEFAGRRSLYNTPLGDILPVAPLGPVREGAFKPVVSKVGAQHPVTAPLYKKDEGVPAWGKWFRLIEAGISTGDVLMAGGDDKPLLVLARQDEGRVATLLSDHIWLWARGYDGGGPQGELLRRLSHWLMKEPELEEENLSAVIKQGKLEITQRTLKENFSPVTITTPDGQSSTEETIAANPGLGKLTVPATQTGLYKIEAGGVSVLAASGELNPLEYSDLRSTANILKPVAEATDGGIFRANDGLPSIRRVKPGRDKNGEQWMGFTQNNGYSITGYKQHSLIPPLVSLLLALGLLIGAWWREGH